MKKLLKGAVVLLIAVALFLSTSVTAKTDNMETLQASSPNQIKPSSIINPYVENNMGPIIWDNGAPSANANLYSSQFDECYPFVSQVADDFIFEEDIEVWDVHWWGGFWNGDPFDPVDFWIYFYKDDGTGGAPTGGGMPDPSPTAVASYFFAGVSGTLDPTSGLYEYEVILDPPFLATASEHYWIVIQADFCYPPQWGWANTDGITLSSAVQGFPLIGTPFWTVIDPEVDMAWYLTGEGEPCEPGIDVEKYVLDLNGEWVDADTEDTALDLPICHDGQFKIVIKNTGDCALINIIVKDMMHDSLKYTGADPEPLNVEHIGTEWVMDWMFPGPLAPGATIEIFVNFHVEGPECSRDYNHVIVEGFCEECPGDIVQDEDWCWVHAYKKSKDLSMPFLKFLQSHPNIFPLLQKLLKTLGL